MLDSELTAGYFRCQSWQQRQQRSRRCCRWQLLHPHRLDRPLSLLLPLLYLPRLLLLVMRNRIWEWRLPMRIELFELSLGYASETGMDMNSDGGDGVDYAYDGYGIRFGIGVCDACCCSAGCGLWISHPWVLMLFFTFLFLALCLTSSNLMVSYPMMLLLHLSSIKVALWVLSHVFNRFKSRLSWTN